MEISATVGEALATTLERQKDLHLTTPEAAGRTEQLMFGRHYGRRVEHRVRQVAGAPPGTFASASSAGRRHEYVLNEYFDFPEGKHQGVDLWTE